MAGAKVRQKGVSQSEQLAAVEANLGQAGARTPKLTRSFLVSEGDICVPIDESFMSSCMSTICVRMKSSPLLDLEKNRKEGSPKAWQQ